MMFQPIFASLPNPPACRYRYMAQLRDAGNPTSPFCGGTLIHPRIVLTAAHVSMPMPRLCMHPLCARRRKAMRASSSTRLASLGPAPGWVATAQLE